MAKKIERSFSVPELKEGSIQNCHGYLMRRTKYLKRWKKEFVDIVPGEFHICGVQMHIDSESSYVAS